MRIFAVLFTMCLVVSQSAIAGSFSFKAGFFNPTGDLKNATGDTWWVGAMEYSLYKLPLATVDLEIGYTTESGQSGGSPTRVRMMPVSLNYSLKTGFTTVFGGGIGIYRVSYQVGTNGKASYAFGYNIFVRQSYANIFIETKYQFANADIDPVFGKQNGVYFLMGIQL
ncbi:MAG: hypothetical protein V2G42_04825 [bacterium JZ-2024 1]